MYISSLTDKILFFKIKVYVFFLFCVYYFCQKKFCICILKILTNYFLLFILIDCDPTLKPSTSAELEYLVNRLEKLLDRLERTILNRELSDTLIINQNQRDNNNKVDLELKQEREEEELKRKKLEKDFTETLEKRITELEIDLNKMEGQTQIVMGYEDIMLNNVQPFLALCKQIGGDVATQAELIKKAFE